VVLEAGRQRPHAHLLRVVNVAKNRLEPLAPRLADQRGCADQQHRQGERDHEDAEALRERLRPTVRDAAHQMVDQCEEEHHRQRRVRQQLHQLVGRVLERLHARGDDGEEALHDDREQQLRGRGVHGGVGGCYSVVALDHVAHTYSEGHDNAREADLPACLDRLPPRDLLAVARGEEAQGDGAVAEQREEDGGEHDAVEHRREDGEVDHLLVPRRLEVDRVVDAQVELLRQFLLVDVLKVPGRVDGGDRRREHQVG